MEFRSSRVYLRELVKADVNENYLNWFKNEKVTEFLEAKNLTQESVVEYIEYGKNSGTYYMYAICDNINDRHIGNVKVGPIDLKHNISDLVVVIGDVDYWGCGLGAEIIGLGNRVAFEKHCIRKLTGGMYEDNIGSIKAYTKSDWVIEGRLVGHYRLNDRVMDRILVSCFNPEYFYLDADNNWNIKESGKEY